MYAKTQDTVQSVLMSITSPNVNQFSFKILSLSESTVISRIEIFHPLKRVAALPCEILRSQD